MSHTKLRTLTEAVDAMNALPDISHDDSERLRGFMRMTAAEIKAVGGVGAATSLEMIGYIRELEIPTPLPRIRWWSSSSNRSRPCTRRVGRGLG